jgi:ribose transport system ATP-binding protein
MSTSVAGAPPPAPVEERQALLQMRGITKRFYGVEVLRNVDLDCDAGEVHAVVGENGAGKSTLMKVLAGVHTADAGTIHIDGEEVSFSHPVQAQQHGVAIIYQEFNLLPDRTVAQNVFLGREPGGRLTVSTREMERRTTELLAELGADHMQASWAVGGLPIAQQQTIEIAKALSLEARILIMDEPTAALSEGDADQLLAMVRRLRDRDMAVLYISHRLREVYAVADLITVLKDGDRTALTTPSETGRAELVNLMVGRKLEEYYPDRAQPEEIGEVRLRVRGGGNPRVSDVSLELRAGEILGLAGLQGAGRTELARALFGVEPFETGQVEINGEQVRIRNVREAVRHGIGYISEDRKLEGLVSIASVKDNVALAVRSMLQRARRKRAVGASVPVSELVDSLDLRARSIDEEVRFLSGGNQQKVVLAKWLATKPDILIFDEPTRGIDVGAKAAIHELMRELAREGKAILMISSELPEAIGMSDRLLVLRGGRIAGELPAGPTEEEVMQVATGETGGVMHVAEERS